MSKKYLGKVCVYCGTPAASTAGEHVFSKQFFAANERADLPQVPTCGSCNTRKSVLENYLLSTIPLGNRSSAAHEHHWDKLPRRLDHNPQLRGDLFGGAKPVWLQVGGGPVLPTATIPIDSERYDEFLGMVARGLTWAHWSTQLDSDISISVHLPYPSAEEVFADANFSRSAWRRVERNLGHDTITYTGWQSIEEPQCTFWRISLLGGVVMGSAGSLDTSTVIGVITAPAHYERLRQATRGA